MGKTGAVKHTHQYFRRADGMWACSGIDGCTHYMPKNMAPAPAGHMSICWECSKPFLLIPINMKKDKPVCDDCEGDEDILEKFLNDRLTRIKPTSEE